MWTNFVTPPDCPNPQRRATAGPLLRRGVRGGGAGTTVTLPVGGRGQDVARGQRDPHRIRLAPHCVVVRPPAPALGPAASQAPSCTFLRCTLTWTHIPTRTDPRAYTHNRTLRHVDAHIYARVSRGRWLVGQGPGQEVIVVGGVRQVPEAPVGGACNRAGHRTAGVSTGTGAPSGITCDVLGIVGLFQRTGDQAPW